MNRNGQPISKISWWRIAILGGLIVASWLLAIVLLPKLGEGRSASQSPTPTQVIVPSSTAQATASATATTTLPNIATATATPAATAPAATSTSTVPAEAFCVANADQLNVRSGPGTTYAVLLQLQVNERVAPVARNGDGTWVQAITRGNVQGWISAQYLNCQGISISNLPVVAVVATPSPTAVAPTPTPVSLPPTPQTFRSWRGEYYGNTSLAGLALVRDDPEVNFDWGSGSPSSSIPADNWSARWSREIRLGTGVYRFQIRVDDGARLWVDGRLLIDQWHAANATHTAEVYLTGDQHNVKVEYVEYGGDALIALSWQRVEQTLSDWRGAYYSNADLAGSPVLVRNDKVVDFEWGNGSPAPGIPTDHFSVRWTRQVSFSEGRYRFRLEADDGVRLWVAGNLLIDRWRGGSGVSTVDQRIWTGTHEVVLEYFEQEGSAKAKLSWEKLNDARTPTAVTPTQTPVITEWRAEYFNNDKLQGTPRVVRNEREISFNWRNNAPVSQVGRDHFSARYTRQLAFPAGVYRWSAAADDGVRVYVDNQLIIDAWQEGPLAEHVTQVPMAEGNHTVRIEYMESTGFAALYVHWERLASTATPTRTAASPSVTAVPPTATRTSTTVPSTATATMTVAPATATQTPTGVPPTATMTMVVPTATHTPTPTATLAPPTLTPTQEPTLTSTTTPIAPTVTSTATSIPPTVTPTTPAGPSIPYRTLLQGDQSFKFVHQTAYRVFESRLAWDTWVEAQGGDPVTLPGVDWGNEAIVAVFLDPQLNASPDSSAIEVAITNIGGTQQTLFVEVTLRNVAAKGRTDSGPKDGSKAPQVTPGTPYHIVAMSRTSLGNNAEIPVYFTDVRGQVVGIDTLKPGAGLDSGPEIPPGIRRSKEPS